MKVTVNGVERAPGSAILVDGIGGTNVVLTFPFPVERASVQQWLPRGVSPTWTDDRTLTLTFAETEAFSGLKMPEARSIDGQSVVELLIVNISYAPSTVLSVYSVPDALAPGGPKPSASWRVPGGSRGAMPAVSPDLSRVLLYERPGVTAAQPPRVLELASRAVTALSLPATAVSFAHGAWLPNGGVVLVGQSVWSGIPGQPLRQVADLTGLAPALAQVSPRGTYVAVAGSDRMVIVDLRDGGLRRVAGASGSCAPAPAWSSDETLLAWIDCATSVVRITDVATNAVVRTIDGAAKSVATMPTGDLIVTRDSGETGEGARSLGVVYGFDGMKKEQYLGYAWSISADGRYLLNIGSCCAGGPTSTLTDLRTPGAQPVRLPGLASWTADGRILVAGQGL